MIIGLTDHQPAFPIIGILRKGEEKKDTNKPGNDLTYFRFVSDDADANTHFNEAYPDQEALRRINAFLPHKTADENMESWKEEWVAGGLVHRCDGETCVLWRNDQGAYSTDPKPCPGKCSQVGRLSIIVPELGRLATVTLLTTSKWDILNLTRQLRSYEALRGDLRGIPFVIIRRPVKVSTPRPNGKRVRAEKWLLSIETQPDWTRLQLGAMAQAALPEVASNGDETEQDQDDTIIDMSSIAAPYDDTTQDKDEIEQSTKSEESPKQREPFQPEELLSQLTRTVKLSKLIDKETGDPLPAKLLHKDAAKLVAAHWTKALDGDKDAYHLSLSCTFARESANDLTAPEADSILMWLLGKNYKKSFGFSFDTPIQSPADQEAKMLHKHLSEFPF